MRLKTALFFLSLLKLYYCKVESCFHQPGIKICPWKVPKFSLPNLPGYILTTSDINFCLSLYSKYRASLGIFCASVSLCGFDVELESNFDLAKTEVPDLTWDTCLVLVSPDKHDCEDIRQKLQKKKLIVGEEMFSFFYSQTVEIWQTK